jgi:cell division septal protein FtsQ
MAILLAAASFPRSSLFPISAIIVEGTSHVTVEEVLARARLRVRDPYFTVHATDVAERIASHPWIAEATVRLEPGGIVRIHIRERSSYAVLAVDDEYYAVDRAGFVLERLAAPMALPLLVSAIKGAARPQLGAIIPSAEAGLALAVLETLPTDLVGPATLMTVAANGDLTLTTEDQIGILLGQSPGLQERVALVVPLLNALRRQPNAIAYVDLRYADNIVIKRASAAKSPSGAGVRP